ncbi:unnamed protein product [Meganyctiphanes norvegica]|uniref:Uncharacterized protein n=1 Tax=Meganyctiphanes norvegica TaxID=48144 RepID=A0AAV2RP42_MEGNR
MKAFGHKLHFERMYFFFFIERIPSVIFDNFSGLISRRSEIFSASIVSDIVLILSHTISSLGLTFFFFFFCFIFITSSFSSVGTHSSELFASSVSISSFSDFSFSFSSFISGTAAGL